MKCPYYDERTKNCVQSSIYPGEKIQQYVFIGQHVCTSTTYEACSAYVRSLFLMADWQGDKLSSNWK